MRIFFMMLAILILLSNCTGDRQKNVIVQVSGIEKIDHNNYNTSNESLYFIKINIINNTDSAFRFWTESCSWQSNWVFNNNSIEFFVDCPSNFPIIKTIEPNQRLTYKGIIKLNDTTNIITNKNLLKLGFVLVKENEITNDADYIPILRKKISYKKNIIWSKPFTINL